MTKEVEKRVREVLFRIYIGSKCDFATLSRITGIPVTTLQRYARMPETIPLDRVIIIADAMDAKPQDVGYMITGRIVK